MSKVRINFYLPTKIYTEIQNIAKEEASTSSEILRKAVRLYLRQHALGDYKIDTSQKENTKEINDEQF